MDTLELDRTEPNNAEGVGMADGDVSAESTEHSDEEILRPLILRLADIRSECFSIGKEPINMKSKDGSKSWTIQGHTIEGVLSSVRALLDKHKVGLTPCLIDRAFNGNRCDVIVDFEFINLDDPTDTKTIRWGGSDTDGGGKAFAKAGTNALKEMLKKTFLITDREDAKEETEQVEHVTDDQLSAQRTRAAKEEAQKARELWASNLAQTIKGIGTVKDLKTLKRESAEQLSKLPRVTQDHFDRAFKEREEILVEFAADQNKETLT